MQFHLLTLQTTSGCHHNQTGAPQPMVPSLRSIPTALSQASRPNRRRTTMDAGHVLPGIAAIQDEMIALRHRIHAHPELGFEEYATSRQVAECLVRWGYEVSTGVGK